MVIKSSITSSFENKWITNSFHWKEILLRTELEFILGKKALCLIQQIYAKLRNLEL